MGPTIKELESALQAALCALEYYGGLLDNGSYRGGPLTHMIIKADNGAHPGSAEEHFYLTALRRYLATTQLIRDYKRKQMRLHLA